ncbi:MAG TPA: hypothetical protein VGC69_13755 [Bordetella sp.]
MTRSLLHYVVFAAGLAVVAWVGVGYAGSNLLALAVTLLIGVAYLAGALELQRYRRATGTLAQAVDSLSAAPGNLDGWLATLHASLRQAVRLRVEGVRAALPGPGLAPYLAGLLVLLGMLGTFLGMIATLRGTGLALATGTDLQAIRDSLAAPVKGLGFAFGTSVAGVAASAMLGLLSALCQRERALAAQGLDARIATTLRVFSPASQREETFKLLQRQADALPALADRMQAMMAAMERQAQSLNDRLSATQEAFQHQAGAAYARLADTAAQALQAGASASARAAGEAIQPAVQATLAGLARDADAWRNAIAQSTREQVEGLADRFAAATTQVADRLDGHAQALAQRTSLLLDSLEQSHASRHRQLGETLARAADGIAAQAEARTQGTLAEMARLTQAAEQAPKAVADVIAELRRKQSEGIERDNAMLAERTRLLDTLGTLLDTVNQAAARQREAVDTLIDTAGERLGHMGERLTQSVEAETGKLAGMAGQMADGAAQAATLGAALGTALQSFSQSNDKLAEQLQRIEAALDKSMARSDEQLAYYVAQAREVVDLSLLSQKQILEDLQRLPGQRDEARTAKA